MTILLGSIAVAMLLALSTPIFARYYSLPMFMVLVYWSSNLRVRAMRLNPWASSPHMRESHGSGIKAAGFQTPRMQICLGAYSDFKALRTTFATAHCAYFPKEN